MFFNSEMNQTFSINMTEGYVKVFKTLLSKFDPSDIEFLQMILIISG